MSFGVIAAGDGGTNTAATYAVAGANQATATQITTSIAYVSSGGTGGVKLPVAAAGRRIYVLKPDNGSVSMTVYPSTGDAISPGAANAGCNVGSADSSWVFVCRAAGTWEMFQSPHVDNLTGPRTKFVGTIVMSGNVEMGSNNVTGANLVACQDFTASTSMSLTRISNTITAFAGGGQASATQLVPGVNRVTTVATAADSVKLPAAAAGLLLMVCNAAATNAMNLFPTSGDAINNLAADAALSIPAGRSVWCAAVDATNWAVTTP